MAENLNTEHEYDRLDEMEAEEPGEPMEAIEPTEPAEPDTDHEAGLVQPSSDAGADDMVLARVNRAPYQRGGFTFSLNDTLMVPRHVLEAQSDNPPFLVEAEAEDEE